MRPSSEPIALDDVDRRVVATLREGLPLVPHPYAAIAEPLGLTEDDVVARTRRLIEGGAIARVAPRCDPERAGGTACAAAIDVPAERVEAVAALLDRMSEIADLRVFDHRPNLWFVVVAEQPCGIGGTQRAIEAATGLEVMLFPKVRDYLVDPAEGADPTPPDAADRALACAARDGLPLDRDPWAAMATAVGIPAAEVLARLGRMRTEGRARACGGDRRGAALEGLTVWDVDDGEVDDVGARLAALPFVAQCRRRPRALPLWPYNLFVVVRGGSRTEIAAARAAIADLAGGAVYGSDVLFAATMGRRGDPRAGDLGTPITH